jgi:hypothetical protein
MDQEIRKGVKTFFLNADASLRPSPTQLQTLFLGGFEVYPLPETKLVPAADQIDCLVGLFRELIVFVNVDGVLPGGTWPELLVRLSRAYGARVRFGVLHHEADPARRSALERVYLVDVQVQAGCIFIDQTLSPDLPKLQRILVANDANGRRKAIRMVCNGTIAFQAGSRRLEARVFEVSISNFLCVFKERDPELNESLRVKGIELALGSTTLKVDAIVLVKRIVGAAREMVYIFGFTGAKGDQLGLAPAETATVIGLIQSYTTQKIHELIDRAFQQRWKQRVLSSRSDPH